MKRIWLAGALGTAALLSACGGGNQESTPSESPSTADTALAPPVDATTGASEAASANPAASTAATATPAPGAGKGAAAPAAAAVAATPPDTFKQCQVCHSVTAGNNGIGPSLAGIYGTKAGTVPGYDFSDAMKNSGLTWNEATLDKYLTSPQAVVPGTKMSFGGIKDADKRKAVIDYLKSL